MSVEFKATEKEYFLLVNHPELVKRAEELGYQGVTLFTENDYDDEDIEYIKNEGKAVVRITYNPKDRQEYGGMSYGWFEGTEIHRVKIELAGNEIDGDESKHIDTLEDAVKYFPKVEDLERSLKGSAIINETDYTGRCGNCHSYLGAEDKYCRYCGTEKGKGEFKPFRNETYCVYGPPVKKKYKCTACGYIWITGQLGGDNSKYCPQCGKKTVNTLQYKALDFFTDAIGFEEPFDVGEEPVLFEEQQIRKLLAQREEVYAKDNDEKEDEFPNDFPFIDRDTILAAMRKAGVEIPEDANYDNYPRTEKEGEQINMAETILKLQGTNPEGYSKVYCHHCGSSVIAALGYTIRGKGYEEIAKGIHAPGEKDSLVYNCGYAIDYDNPDSKNADHIAYLCLKCGMEFGKLELPKELDKVYKNHLARKDAEKLGKNAAEFGKNAMYAAVGLGVVAGDAAKKAANKIGDAAKNIAKASEKEKMLFYEIGYVDDKKDGWGEENDLILEKAAEMELEAGYIQAQGMRSIYVHCTQLQIDELIASLGDGYGWDVLNSTMAFMAKKDIAAQKKTQKDSADEKKEKKKQNKLDEQLKAAVTEYNAAYTNLNDHGTKLFNQRERAIDLLDNVEHLINSIANHPKEFDSDIAEIQVHKKEFRDVCDFAKKELEAAQKSAVGVGAGVAGGMAVASLAPSAAMWIATTFGTASTGTAISALSGAAATNAALAWLGGGALAAGGGGMAAGNAFLALAGPVGWSIAGATLLTSIVLFANKKIKLDKEKKEEIESVLKNTEQLKETDSKLAALLEKTEQIRHGLNEQYTSGMSCFGKNFMDLSDDAQTMLATIVNNAKALSASLGEGV